MTKVSIIVPVYNTYNYLNKCLESLVNQTLSDIEIIVVNDGSPDDSEGIIKEYAKKYSSIKYYKKKNGGLSSARNFGIKHATGEYIGFVDSDDYVDVTMYEKLYNKAVSTKSDIVCCQLTYLYPNNKTILHHYKDLNIFSKSVCESPEILNQVKSYACNKIYKRELWNKFTFPNQYFEDSAVIYNVLNDAKKIDVVDEGLYYYRKDVEGAITKKKDEATYDIFKSCDSILKCYNKYKSNNTLIENVNDIIIGHITIRVGTYINSFSFKKGLNYIKYARGYLNKNIPNWKNKVYYHKNKVDSIRSMRYRYCVRNYLCYIGLYSLVYLKKLIRKGVK